MSRVLFLIIILLSVTHIFSTYNNTDNEVLIIAQYLQHYGYLQEVNEEQLTSLNNTELTHAISLFQQFYHLPGNGELNAETRNLMNQPRCGVKDFSTKKFSSLRSKWSKTHLTWNFFLGDIKHVQLATTAFEYWSNVSSLTFEHKTWNPDILISYKAGLHTFTDPRKKNFCTSPFDGPGNILAHAYYPTKEREFTSEIHVDNDEVWFIELRENPSDTYHLIHTLIHEIGHALGLDHSTRKDSIMFPFALKLAYPPKLSMEDIYRIRNLYGENVKTSTTVSSSPLTTDTYTSTVSTTTSVTESTNIYPDLCALQDIDTLTVINQKLFITYQRYLWTSDLDGKYINKPILLTDYMSFLPTTFTRFIAAYQAPSDELILFTDNLIYMITYPDIALVSEWPKQYKDIGLPENAKINSALVTNTGHTYILYNDHIAAKIDNCNSRVTKYESLSVKFPGVPQGISLAFRYIDGNLYFINKNRYMRFNEFENSVVSTGQFDLSLVNIICPRKGLLHQLRDLLARLTRIADNDDTFY